MKKFSVFPLVAALAFFVSCQKQQTEEEKKAEVERQVQDRLAAERQQDEKQRLAQEQANLEAREKALADRESAAAVTPAEEPTVTEIEPAVQETTETRSTASYGMFYRKLEPHGEWRETADYGYVWQPRVAEESREWRPYTEGRWVYSDAGWTWVSDEPFGWATYHYGRWLRLRRVGWVWVPGDEWAPAWVSWRTSKDYVGWAPLPPEARFDRRSGIHAWADSYYDIGPDQYAFVPNNEFGAEHVRRVVVPAERNVTIVVETTNVTNITYANTTIVNEGPKFDEMRSYSRRPIERYRLRRQSRMDAEFSSATVRGDELEVSAPAIVEVPDMPRPRRVKEHVAEVTIDTGWTAIADRSAAERARTKMRADATPPPSAPPKKFVKPAETSTATATPAATASARTTVAASATPAATRAATATATPAVSPTVRMRPSPATTPTASARAVVSATPVASPTVRIRPSATSTPKATPTVAPSAAASPSATLAITPSPKATISPPARTRPLPSIQPAVTPATRESIPPVRTPRAIPPPVNTPAATATPLRPAESAAKPLPSIAPVTRPTALPRAPLATPQANATAPMTTAAPETPRRTLPRTAPSVPAPPPSAASPNATPVSSPIPDDQAKTRRPRRPGEAPTPTPAGSRQPN